jgi:deoxyadenosine/deoxycytidine kinase
LFAKVTLKEDEFKLYNKLFDIINPQILQPDILIYLHSPVSKLQENIKKRNRTYEQDIPNEYLTTLQDTYTQYIKQHDLKTLFVDATNADFINNEVHLNIIIDALNQDFENGVHYITLP